MPEVEDQTSKDNLAAVYPLAEKDPLNAFQMVFAGTPLLKSEDRERYELFVRAVIAERNPQSFLEFVEVKDYVDTYWEEQRWSASIVEVIENAKVRWATHPNASLLQKMQPKNQQEVSFLNALPAIEALLG